MAQIETSNSTKKHLGVKKTKKLSTRVDLTPMVDLGFLLITFFIFTTTLAQPKVMRLVMPDDRFSTTTTTPESKTITLMLGKDNTIFYYEGKFNGSFKKTGYNSNGLRTILLKKIQELEKRQISRKELVVLIKTSDSASYGNIVNVLDEMLINGIGKYMVLDPDKTELNAIKY